jgi:hypothetical protein
MWLGAQKTPCNFTVTAHLRGQLYADDLQAAFGRLKAVHPLLAVRIGMDYQHKPWFYPSRAEGFSVRQVPRLNDDTWIHEVGEELRHGFPDERGPLARCVLVQGEGRSELIVTAHHAVADGLSGVFLLRDLLRLLADPQREVTPFSLRPNIDQLLPISPDEDTTRFRSTTQTHTRLLLDPPHSGPSDLRATGDYPIVVAPREKHFIIDPWSLTAEQSAQVTERCHHYGVSVHSAIAAAMLLAFADLKGNPAP